MPTEIRVDSEVGRLTDVMVHTPGDELLAVTPDTRGAYLYNDLLDLAGAREEHRRFVAVLSRFCRVHQTATLAREALASPLAREFLLGRSEEATRDHALREPLGALGLGDLVDAFVVGWQPPRGPIADALGQRFFALPPLPNLFFSRDAAMVLGDQVAVASMHFPARWPEELLLRTIVGHHPLFARTPIAWDGADERRFGFTLEGGDVHPLRRDLVLVGVSERTCGASVDLLADALFARGEVTDVVVVVLPREGFAIHLDMVFTQLDRELCLLFAPTFLGPTRAPILHRRRGRASVRQAPSLLALLADLGMPMEPVVCGSGDEVAAAREQWLSGCNALALAPGVVVAYARNVATLRAMEAAGFTLLPAEELLARPGPPPPGRLVVTLSGSELVRGGGGPRCMTMPLGRAAVPGL